MEALKKIGIKLLDEKRDKGDLKTLARRFAVSFALGFMFSCGGRKNEFAPFGNAFVCASGSMIVPALLGSLAGYFLTQGSLFSLRYSASVLAAAVIGGTLRETGKLTHARGYAAAVSFITLTVTGLAVALADGITLAVAARYMSEAVTGAATAYFMSRVISARESYRSIGSIDAKNLSALVVCVSILLLSLSSVSIYGFVPARLLTVIMILVCSRYAHEAGGAIVGAAAGAAMSLGGGGSYLLACYSFGGLAGGAFSSLGKIGTAVAFITADCIVAVTDAENSIALYTVIEAVVGSLIFIAFPPILNKRLENVFTPVSVSPVLDGIKGGIVFRLTNAARKTGEISDSLTAVSKALRVSENSSAQRVYESVRSTVCENCGLRTHCDTAGYDTLINTFNDMAILVEHGDIPSAVNIPSHFAGKCIRVSALCDTFRRQYTSYIIRRKAESRIDEVRSTAAEQFAGISYMLNSLSDELEMKTTFDAAAAERIKNALCGDEATDVTDCFCSIDKYDRMTVELNASKDGGLPSRKKLTETAQHETEREFELPVITAEGNVLHVVIKERAAFRTVCGCAQFAADGEKVCGDSFTTFTTDDGMFYAVMCDGMGTGAMAAVSAALACSLTEKLISAGFGTEAAVKSVNSALIVKSGEEVSVTLDILEINLRSGESRFYKAGCAPTLVKRKGRIINVALASLPLGILRTTELSSVRGAVSSGDIILMMTDGIDESLYDEIGERLRKFRGGDISAFAKEIASFAKNRIPERTDDITVTAVAILKND